MSHDPILHLLGLARKAGRLEIGEEPVGAVCRARQAKLVLIAGDAASNTYRRAAHFGEAGNVLWLPLPHSKDELGFCLGRSSCAMLALTDIGLASALVKKLSVLDPERYAAAAVQLDQRAQKALERQREQRRHEKNLRQGKHKPWAPPPPDKAPDAPTPPRPKRAGSGPDRDTRPRAGSHPNAKGPESVRKTGADGRSDRPRTAASKPPRKPGPGGRRMQGPVSGLRPKQKP